MFISHTFTGYSQSLCVLWYISWHVLEGKSMAVHSGPRTGTVRRARSRLTRENQGTQRTPNPQTSPNQHLQSRAHRSRVCINLYFLTAGCWTKRPNLHYYTERISSNTLIKEIKSGSKDLPWPFSSPPAGFALVFVLWFCFYSPLSISFLLGRALKEGVVQSPTRVLPHSHIGIIHQRIYKSQCLTPPSQYYTLQRFLTDTHTHKTHRLTSLPVTVMGVLRSTERWCPRCCSLMLAGGLDKRKEEDDV